MPWNKKKSYNLLKSDKKSKTANGTYTKKTETKKNFKLFEKFISKLINWFNIEASKTGQHQKFLMNGTLSCHKQNFSYQDRGILPAF